MKIELWNYSTNAFVLYDTRTIPSTDTFVQGNVPSNVTQYINSTNRRVRAKVSFFAPVNIDRSYAFRVDLVSWTVTYP